MDKIWVGNFRCFREKQDVPLKPLTLLVGENSTGKTSFLAMINVLMDQKTRQNGVPNFKEPYDLGSFDEIAHYRGGRGGRADYFIGGCELRSAGKENTPYSFEYTFKKNAGAPFISKTRSERKGVWMEAEYDPLTESPAFPFPVSVLLGSSRGAWEWKVQASDGKIDIGIIPLEGSPEADNDEKAGFEELAALSPPEIMFFFAERALFPRVVAPAPVRSNPKRTYDLTPLIPDHEGSYIPSLFAHLSAQETDPWKRLKEKLEAFGKESGLFDEIDVKRPFRKNETGPFQILVRKAGGKIKGPWRNLQDVGYGVSQILPTATELFFRSDPALHLLQQPETHLHPSAQAALGSQLCRTASEGKQLIVETHSDYLMDRVRMDVRDQKTDLTPEDVIVLFFERDGLDVRIWPIRFDELGNVKDAPNSYRRFFMSEVNRSIGL
ncbi:MAG: AAA family ATPase [Candidatus Poribacteria bacterium]|nr:AAA family ATPase [Candidatus Poribacteria bacterium]